MSFSELAEKRYSVRKFSEKEVGQEIIDRIIGAGLLAPTACNNQPQKIYVIRSKEALAKLQKCKTSHFGETLAFLVCADKNLCWEREYDGKSSCDTDASIVTTYMMLEACGQGLGSTWVMHFIPDAVRSEFNIPENEEPVSLLVMGYPAEDSKPAPLHFKSKSADETVKYL